MYVVLADLPLATCVQPCILPKSYLNWIGLMGRKVRDSRLATREARLKLATRHEPYWRLIHEGLHLGYRKGTRGGVWVARFRRGEKYAKKVLGGADDALDAESHDVLTFKQAQEAALSLSALTEGSRQAGLTVSDAAGRYMDWFRLHRKSIRETEHTVRAHILPALGDCLVSELTAAQLRKWMEQLAAQPARVRTSKLVKRPRHRAAPHDADQKRARQATANRIYTVLRALLNKAFQDGLVSDDTPWRQVKPFAKVDEPRIRFLTDDEAIRLVRVCGADLKRLVRAALLTGARFGELSTLRIQDVNLRTAQVYIGESKSGRPRYVPLNDEGLQLFRGLVKGKPNEELAFQKEGHPWGKNHHVRLLQEACKAAKVHPAISFHELRHTYASHLAQAGVDLLTISKLLGHADTRITSRHYAHLADRTLAQAVTKLPSFGRRSRRNSTP